MIKQGKRIGAVAVACSVLSYAHIAQAVFITTQATIDANSGAAFPLVNIDTIVSSGKTFTNTTDPADPPGSGPGNFPSGTPVRSIVAGIVTQALDGITYTPVNGFNNSVNQLVAIAAVSGTFEQDLFGGNSGVFGAAYTQGRVGFVSVPAGTFDANDPNTWGINPLLSPSFSFGSEYALGPKDVVDGFSNNGDPVAFPANQINTSTLDQGGPQEQTQGRFKFLEASVAENLNQGPGDAFVTNTPNPAIPAPNMPGLMITTADVVEQQSLATITGAWGGNIPGARSVLDGLSQWGFGQNFANWGSGLGDDFNPVFAGGFSLNGDFRATDTANSRPAIMVSNIPEPAAFVVWGLLGAVGFCGYHRRK